MVAVWDIPALDRKSAGCRYFFFQHKLVKFQHLMSYQHLFQFCFFSLQMVLMWTCGDVFKTTYFYLRKTPPQFVICGCLQVMVDVAILTQVWLYYENTAKRKKTQINMHF